jgi:hypothetical protein
MALPIEAGVQGSGAMRTACAGNRHADAVSLQVSSNCPAARGRIADEPFRTPLGAARPATCHGAWGPQGDQDERLMTRPRRAAEGHGLALALGPAMDCGPNAAWAAPEGCGLWGPFLAPAACGCARLLVLSTTGIVHSHGLVAAACGCRVAKR